mmetsp:Transcript_129888/g.277317  ORF Transcript_129888/g.277317 Transcript_129888/m.277317 type:complete len:283 (+) Transcript_129888:965-1813(+)
MELILQRHVAPNLCTMGQHRCIGVLLHRLLLGPVHLLLSPAFRGLCTGAVVIGHHQRAVPVALRADHHVDALLVGICDELNGLIGAVLGVPAVLGLDVRALNLQGIELAPRPYLGRLDGLSSQLRSLSEVEVHARAMKLTGLARLRDLLHGLLPVGHVAGFLTMQLPRELHLLIDMAPRGILHPFDLVLAPLHLSLQPRAPALSVGDELGLDRAIASLGHREALLGALRHPGLLLGRLGDLVPLPSEDAFQLRRHVRPLGPLRHGSHSPAGAPPLLPPEPLP